MTYKGGPGSVLGIVGRTSITFADPNQRTGKQNPNLFNSGFFNPLPKNQGNSFSLEGVARAATEFLDGKIPEFQGNQPIARIGNVVRGIATNAAFKFGTDQLTNLENTTIFAFPEG